MIKTESEQTRILVVDDEENMRHMLCTMLRKAGYPADDAADGEQGLALAVTGKYSFILSDIRMPTMTGQEFLRQAVEAGVTSTVIMMSAYGTVDTAIECMKLGAYDYISKPFKNDEIILVLRKAEERERLKAENKRLLDEVYRQEPLGSIVSKNPCMIEIMRLISRVADYRVSVLITGESGTGKELVARAIHDCSNRKKEPFIAVNCAAIPESLLESELFGHARGAFTDAVADKSGLFEQADGGTLFLDEIGEMSPSLQAKLLRVLQEGEIRRVGDAKVRKVDVRVVSATCRDLTEDMGTGRFREDLYYRLNVFGINLPPLRERREDIPLLVDHFLHKHDPKGEGLRPSAEVMQSFILNDWPGNVRELENCIERCLILSDFSISGSPGDKMRGKENFFFCEDIADSLSIKEAEEQIERILIRKALDKTKGNRTHAAKLLEISHRALLYKLKEYEID